ncbi:MAG: glycosyltransferase [Myxococcota bacterium]
MSYSSPKTIAMISRGDAASGGAGRVAEQLSIGLREREHRVTHFVREPPREAYADGVRRLPRVKGDVIMRNLLALDPSGAAILAQPELWHADLVHFHDFSVAWGALAAFFVARKRPVVFTLHDYSGLTGGCLSPLGCELYQSGCGDCPQVGQWPLSAPVDMTSLHFSLHRRIAGASHVVAATPSQDLAHAAREGAWRGGDVRVIPNAVDVDTFHPSRYARGRERLGLSDNERCLLFVAVDVLNERKGLADLVSAFRRLRRDHPYLRLAVVGELEAWPERWSDLRDAVIVLGSVDDDRRLAEIYAAADGYVVPSHADTFNLTIIEAMSCGTPVVAYPTGGMREVFEHGRGGWFASEADDRALETMLREVLPRLEGDVVRRTARDFAVENYAPSIMVARYLELYEELRTKAS